MMKNKLLLILLVYLVTVTGIHAQSSCCNYYDNGQDPLPGVAGETFGVGLGDINGDGYLDAAVIDAYDDMELYLNDGTGTFSYLATYGSGNAWFDAAMTDVDQDGDMDIIVSAFYSGDGCQVWLNNGSGVFNAGQGGIGTSISMRKITVADLNGDGLPDLFLPAYSGSGSQVWLNDGSGVFVNTNQVVGGGNCTQAALADFDGDGDPDAFIARTNGSANTVFINDGNGFFADSQQALGSAFTSGAQPADIDNDGDIDVVAANWQVPSQVWINDGSAGFSAGITINNNNYAKAIEIRDIDYDCDADVIIGSYGSPGLQVWTNDGVGNFDLCFSNPIDMYSHGIAVGDMNNDLMQDIWVGNFSSSSGDHIFLKAAPVLVYDTLQLCPSDSVYVGCDWQTDPGDYLQAINCDTLCWYHVEVTTIDTTVVTISTTLYAQGGYDAYQWIDCDTYLPVTDADSNVFHPFYSGTYAVVIFSEGCSDTSDCHWVQTPVAGFTGSPTNGTVPLDVQFTDQSIDSVNSWHWYFGDGAEETIQNPVHTYPIPGTYDVTLEISGPGGSDSFTRQYYINTFWPETVADFTGNPLSGLSPLDVQFTDLSTDTISSWSWDFGDGETSTVQNPIHTYNLPGLYSVTLSVGGPGGGASLTKEDYILVSAESPVVDFVADPLSGTEPLEVYFTDLTSGIVDDWQWSFGDGASSTQQNPVHTYVDAGSFDVTLVVTGPGGQDSLTKENYIQITVGLDEKNESTILVYPNPVTDQLHLAFKNAGNRTLVLKSMEGLVVRTVYIDLIHYVMHLDDLSSGTYVLNVFGETGQETTIKIVKQ